jgi:hypothetical protein
MRNQSLEFMQANFGKAGAYYYWISRGVDNREVRANRIRKSVGAENTFFADLSEFEAMVAELQPLIDKVWRHCEDKGSRGRTVTLKVKFNDFETIMRSRSAPVAVSSRSDLERLSVALLQNEMPLSKPVRLLGISLSALLGDDQDTEGLGEIIVSTEIEGLNLSGLVAPVRKHHDRNVVIPSADHSQNRMPLSVREAGIENDHGRLFCEKFKSNPAIRCLDDFIALRFQFFTQECAHGKLIVDDKNLDRCRTHAIVSIFNIQI